MTGPGCSHPIYTQTLTEVYQAVRYFSPCYFHVCFDSDNYSYKYMLHRSTELDNSSYS